MASSGPSTYAMIQGGIVQNIVLVNSGDYMDPSYTWVDITNLNPQPQISWTYDGTNFAQPGLPNDAYGRTVVFSTNGTIDSYLVAGTTTYHFPAGTPQAAVYLSIAIQNNIALFQIAVQTFVDGRYSLETRFNFIALYTNAQINGYTNRMTYIAQLLTWQAAVIGYVGTYIAGVMAMGNAATVAATSANFATLTSADPLLSPITAVQILN